MEGPDLDAVTGAEECSFEAVDWMGRSEGAAVVLGRSPGLFIVSVVGEA